MYGPYRIDPADVPDDLHGLDAALLEDLHDLVSAYGTAIPQGRVHRLSTDHPKPIHVSVCVPPALSRTIFVSDMPGGISKLRCHAFALDPAGNSCLLWSHGISLDDIRGLIVGFDQAFREHRDARGRRTRIVGPQVEDKMRVDVLFAEGGYVSFDAPLEVMLLRVDSPEDVALLGRTFEGAYLYCHRRDHGRLVHLHGLVVADIFVPVLRKHGIRSPSEVYDLPSERAAIVKQDLNEALREQRALNDKKRS